jgi:hypothetical protein
MLNELLLLSGNDIPFFEAQITIHQPTIKEIGLIGEENFYTGCEMLNFSKDILNEKDRISLANQTDFEVLMSIMTDNNTVMQKNRVAMTLVLSLLFPEYNIRLTTSEIALLKEGEVHSINSANFEKFKEILTTMFCLNGHSSDDNPTYNPAGKLARQISEKLKERRKVLAEQKGDQKIAVLSRYVSILAVGLPQDMNSLMQYTVYQLFDKFNRFELKQEFDYYIQAQMAGARDLKEVDNWKKDIHP